MILFGFFPFLKSRLCFHSAPTVFLCLLRMIESIQRLLSISAVCLILTLPLFLLLTKASIRSAAFFLDTEKTDCCILPLFLSIPLELLF